MNSMIMNAAFYRGNKTFTVESKTVAEPAAGEVKIRIAYCGVCGTDMHVYHGNMDARVGFERVIGHEMSGTIVALGADVEGLAVGQPVVVRPLDHCGTCPACKAGHTHICHNLKFLGLDTDGAMQEFWNVPAHTVHVLPDSLPLDHGALVEPVSVACHDVRLSRLKAGEDVLVIGGGTIGVLVSMVAREAGANVTISEVNPHRLEMAKKMGFTTINPAEVDLAQTIHDATGQKGADVVFEVSGSQAGIDAMTACAATRGRLVMVAIHAKKPEMDMFRLFWRELELIGVRVYEKEDYEKAIDLLASGAIDPASVITDITPLSGIQDVFESLNSNPTALKSLVKVSG